MLQNKLSKPTRPYLIEILYINYTIILRIQTELKLKDWSNQTFIKLKTKNQYCSTEVKVVTSQQSITNQYLIHQ